MWIASSIKFNVPITISKFNQTLHNFITALLILDVVCLQILGQDIRFYVSYRAKRDLKLSSF